MENINTKEYWETRFETNSWGESGNRQTREYAKANVEHMSLNKNFDGSILDFGCALGDAIPVYNTAFPNASISGIDISESAIIKCKKQYGNIAKFYSGDYNSIMKNDIIIASHVMEHITDDRIIVNELLSKCKEIFIFVPFRENPLYREHVNYYEENYYDSFNVLKKSVFKVHFKYKLSLKEMIKELLKGRINDKGQFTKEIIMFRIKGKI